MEASPSLDVRVYPVCDESPQRHGLVVFFPPEDRNTGLGKWHALAPVDVQPLRRRGVAEALRRNRPPRGRERSGMLQHTPLTRGTCQSFAGASSWTSLWWDWPYGSAKYERVRVLVLVHVPWCSTPLFLGVVSAREKVKKWIFLQSDSGLTGLMSSLLVSTMDAEKKRFNKLSFN